MTEEDSKSQLGARARRALVGAPESAAHDPFEDPELDALLKEKVEQGGDEPKLLIVDRLLNRLRIRREV